MRQNAVDKNFIDQIISHTCVGELVWISDFDASGSASRYSAMCTGDAKTSFYFTEKFFGYGFLVSRQYGGWAPAVTEFNCSRKQGKFLSEVIRLQIQKRKNKERLDESDRISKLLRKEL